jgi:hypothetical protein
VEYHHGDPAGCAFEDDERLVHVGVPVRGEDSDRRDNDARDLGERRNQTCFFAAGLWLTGSSGAPLTLLSFITFFLSLSSAD